MSQLQALFARRLRKRRKEMGITQAELARRLGMHQPALCDLEKGRHAPTLETVEKIATVLDIPASMLVG